MADKIVILEDSEGNNIYPISRGLATNSVDTNAIQNGAVTSAKIEDSAVTSSKIDWDNVWDNNSIVRTYSDANGRRAIVYGDGTLICTRKITATINANTSWGSLYRGTTSDFYTFSPTSAPDFIATPTATYTVNTNGSDSCMLASWNNSEPNTNNSAGRYAIPSGSIAIIRTSSATNVSVTINAIAIGRWK